jgi:serine/threonine protein kinase
VKCFPELSSDQEQIFIREIEAFARLNHSCIVPFFGYVLRTPSAGPRIVTRFMSGGSLRDVLDSHPSWWNGTVKSIVVSGIVRGMMKIHEVGIIRRDLKLNNILLDENHRPHICDFGSSRDQSFARTLTGQTGTPFSCRPSSTRKITPRKSTFTHSHLSCMRLLLVIPCSHGHWLFLNSTTKSWKVIRMTFREIEGFVRSIIERGWSPNPEVRLFFTEIYEEPKQHNFCIAHDGFDAAEVRSCLGWVDSSWDKNKP